MSSPVIDDLTLHAWLDDELPPARRAEVEAWLHEHPEDAARVRLWSADGAALRASFDAVLDEPVPPRLMQVAMESAAPPRASAWPLRAAAVALFVLGGAVGAGLGWRLKPEPRLDSEAVAGDAWTQRAAMAHRVYTPEVRHAVEVKAQEEHLSRWLTKRVDVPVKLFDLREQGFELVGGRLLPDENGPCAQLMYQAIETAAPGITPAAAPRPTRVTVYLRKPERDTPAAFHYEQQGPLGLFYWVEGDSAHGKATGYALVGELPRERLLALAEAIYRQGADGAPK